MAENREASYARETVQPPKTALDHLSYADIAKRPLAVATALHKNPDAEKIASSILGKEPREHETNPMTLSENPDVREIQSKIYTELGIDTNTDANNPIKKLGKGVIDGLVIGNAEIVAKIQKDGIDEFLSNLKAQLTTLDGWQKIAEALGKSVLELFSGDAYKTGKSVAELGLITTGMGAAGSLVKMAGKEAVKASVKIGTETVAKEAATVAAYGAGKTLEKTGNALQVPAKTIAKASEIAIAGVKKVGEVSGVNQVLKKGTEAVKDTIEAAGVSKVVEGTKNAVKRSLQGLSAVHIVGSAEGFPKHPKAIEAGAIFPEGRPSLNGEKPKSPERNIDMGSIAKQSLLPEEIEFLSTYFNDGALEQTLQAKIGLENYIDRGFHGAVFEVPGKDQVAKLPLNKENLETIGAEMARHDAFQGAFDDIKISYPTLLSKAGLTPDIAKLRREAANNIYVPERRQIPERNDVYVMDRVKGAEPIDYFKQVAIIKRDFPDYIERNGINLDGMNAAAVERFTTWIYEKHGKPKPNVSEISVSVIPKEQLNTLVDMVRALNKNGTYHGDLHQGNILIGKEPIGTNGMRQIHLIDFGTAGKQGVSGSPQKIEKSLSIPKGRELEELMEKYPNEPPDVIRVMHTLGSAISPNK